MRSRAVRLLLGAILLVVLAPAAHARSSGLVTAQLDGVVDPFTASYLEGVIRDAQTQAPPAILITIDTPGGLDSSMRRIIKSILNSSVPVICYVSPEGSRAASAGTFILLSCPVAAMAPGTNVGAAHPVGVLGAIEQDKATNDAVAFIRSLAERRGRNPDWAESAVRESKSVSAQEAKRLGVIDVVAPNLRTLLEAVDGKSVEVAGSQSVVLETRQAGVSQARSMGLGSRLLHTLLNPGIAFALFYLGLILIVVEFLHPGLSVPGIIGVLSLIGAFVSFGMLPVQLIGIVLLLASAVFFLLELKHPGIGVPTAGGLVTLVLGGLLLFDPRVPGAGVSGWVIGPVAIAAALFFTFVVRAAMTARRLPVDFRPATLVGAEGIAVTDLDPVGSVRVALENWTAEARGGRVPKGSKVRVVSLEGLKLKVEVAEQRTEAPAEVKEG